jgi:hypothetical protein
MPLAFHPFEQLKNRIPHESFGFLGYVQLNRFAAISQYLSSFSPSFQYFPIYRSLFLQFTPVSIYHVRH